MTTQTIGLFKAMAAKMGYLNHRQEVLAQNIANSDTPDYRARDLTKVDFSRVVKEATGSKVVHPVATHHRHMPSPGKISEADNRAVKISYEVAPAGNSVILEEQMIKAAKTTMDYNLMTTLYQKNIGMIRTAIGSR